MATKGNKQLIENSINGLPKNTLVVIVKTEWNAAIVDELEAGCKKILKSKKVDYKTIIVPGAVEIPFAINAYGKTGKDVAAYIALGAVIKGDTPHFEYVCQSITQGITLLNTQLTVPVIFGVLTVNTEAQAKERLGGKHGHKGEEAAITALKMIALNDGLKQIGFRSLEV
jgi:6,7-dimethyl-8-ribityllumazine synthase